ncbi:hypothetical protein ACS0TY_036920 [Phlomoides rotata]
MTSQLPHSLFVMTDHERGFVKDYEGCPMMTATDDSNPWWSIFKQAIAAAGGKLAKLEILATTTNSRFFRRMGIPTLGFSPMKNTPILLHDHNEVLLINGCGWVRAIS